MPNAYLCPSCDKRKVQYISANRLQCNPDTGGCGSTYPKERFVK